MLGQFQGREKAGQGSGPTAVVSEISLSLCYSGKLRLRGSMVNF